MAVFLMLGKYSSEGMKGISSGRTKKAHGIVKKYGGDVQSVHALLGGYDVALLVNFPGINETMKASIALSKLTGISFTTFPALPLEEFDKLTEEI